MNALACPSRIVAVTVYARGATVTRAVELPKDLPETPCDLLVSDLPALAAAGSLRAEVEGERAVVALKTHLCLPEVVPAQVGPDARARELELRAHRLRLEQEHLHQRRGVLLALSPRLRGLRREGVDPASRARDALAANALVTDLASGVDARLRELSDALREVEREQEAVAHEQAAVGQTGDPTRAAVVRLGPGSALESLRIQYVVNAARWWPAYAARLSEGGTKAEWALEAFVAQTSGEDWDGVELALSTADLIHDARLPELASLRLGRRQPARSSGFRPPPEGLDALFRGFDRDQDRLAGPPPPPPAPKPKPQPRPAPPPEPEPLEQEDARMVTRAAPAADWMEVGEAPPQSKRKRSISFGAASLPAGAPPSASKAGRGGGGGGEGFREKEEEPPPEAIEPADAWLDFDGLTLSEGANRERRGRLRRAIDPAVETLAAAASAALEGVGAPSGASDPLAGRGQFDHQYRADGRVDLASRREAQRVPLSGCEADCLPRVRIVPGVEQAAYREVELRNPFPGPLLAGPVDVFLDGSLLTTTGIGRIGRGGPLQLGLGVEDRVRVARNARVAESTAGLIGKTTAVEHTVTIDLASTLPHAVTVSVVDRVPVSDDDDVTIELVRSSPEGVPYDQRDREAEVRGGLQWTVELASGADARIEFVYRVSFPSRRELVGGNRRD